jgi:hypothetical protein
MSYWGGVLVLCQGLRYVRGSCTGQTDSFILFPQIIGALVGLLAVIAIGVGVGVSLSNKNRSSSNGTTSNDGSGNSTSPVQQDDPNDPSTFKKDDRLKQSFYGMAYSPNGVLYPECGAALADVITDIQLMSQLTKVSVHDPTLRSPKPVKPPPNHGGRLFLGHIGGEGSEMIIFVLTFLVRS